MRPADAPGGAGHRGGRLFRILRSQVHPRLRIRRSTIVLVVALIGLGVLYYSLPPQKAGQASLANRQSPATVAPTTTAPASSTTSSTTSTTSVPPTATTVVVPSTSTSVATTTTVPVTTTTTVAPASTSTSSTTLGAATTSTSSTTRP